MCVYVHADPRFGVFDDGNKTRLVCNFMTRTQKHSVIYGGRRITRDATPG